MLLRYKFVTIGSFVLFALILSACGHSYRLKDGECNMRDERFVCHGQLNAAGQGQLAFTQVPNQAYYLKDFKIEKSDEAAGEILSERDCQGDEGGVDKGKIFKFNCQKIDPGVYYVKFKLKAVMPASYHPLPSESCLLYKGARSEWQCTTSGEFRYVIH